MPPPVRKRRTPFMNSRGYQGSAEWDIQCKKRQPAAGEERRKPLYRACGLGSAASRIQRCQLLRTNLMISASAKC